MPIETQAAFARRLGVNRSTVNRHIAAGRVVVRDGKIDVDASLARLAATTGTRPDVAARHAQARAPQGGAGQRALASPAAARPPPPDIPAPSDHETGSKARYKAIALHFENADIKLGMALRRGIRHPLPELRREAAGLGATLRSALERLVDQTAPRLAVLHNPADRAALLAAEIAAVRRLIRHEFPRALRRIRRAARA